MTIWTRYNNFDVPRPPLQFGIKWDNEISDPTTSVTRVGDAAAMGVNTAVTPHVSDFSNYYPWKGMVRTKLAMVGDVHSLYGETDEAGASIYSDDQPGDKICVYVPKFYERFVLQTTRCYYYISPYKLPGYRLHPAFQRGSLGEINGFYVGAFEASLTDTHLDSYADSTIYTNVDRDTFRTAAGEIAGNYQIIDFTMWEAIKKLLLIEYATMDSQSIFEGIAFASGVKKTGYTSANGPTGSVELGNGSGNVMAPSGDFAFSYRGIENLYGNTDTLVDGIGIDTSRNLWVNFYWGVYTDTFDTAHNYSKMGFVTPNASGYITFPQTSFYYGESNWMIWPSAVSAGSASTYMCDYYTQNGFSVPRIPKVGGNWNSGTKAGLFCTDVSFATSGADTSTGTRIAFVPWDNTKYYSY